jgi:hypothetical protein
MNGTRLGVPTDASAFKTACSSMSPIARQGGFATSGLYSSACVPKRFTTAMKYIIVVEQTIYSTEYNYYFSMVYKSPKYGTFD